MAFSESRDCVPILRLHSQSRDCTNSQILCACVICACNLKTVHFVCNHKIGTQPRDWIAISRLLKFPDCTEQRYVPNNVWSWPLWTHLVTAFTCTDARIRAYELPFYQILDTLHRPVDSLTWLATSNMTSRSSLIPFPLPLQLTTILCITCV